MVLDFKNAMNGHFQVHGIDRQDHLWKSVENKEKKAPQRAMLYDTPERTPNPNTAFKHEFEVVALIVAGLHRGLCLGALTWGYTCIAGQRAIPLPTTMRDYPSADWIEACSRWSDGYGSQGEKDKRCHVPMRR
ncbi:MAG: hypothetical protein V4505_28070 [Pseudomonadota bacterium]